MLWSNDFTISSALLINLVVIIGLFLCPCVISQKLQIRFQVDFMKTPQYQEHMRALLECQLIFPKLWPLGLT